MCVMTLFGRGGGHIAECGGRREKLSVNVLFVYTYFINSYISDRVTFY